MIDSFAKHMSGSYTIAEYALSGVFVVDVVKVNVLLNTSRKHAYIILIPLNPTFI